MADPIPYDVSYSFSGFQQTNPSSPLPAPPLDNELANIERTLDSLVGGLMDVRRSDGHLHNQSVGPDQLSPALTFGFTNRGQWQAGTLYEAGDGVAWNDLFYSARAQNTATDVNRPDLDPGTWMYLFGVAAIVVPDHSIGMVKLDTPTAAQVSGAAQKAANLADMASVAIARANIGAAGVAVANTFTTGQTIEGKLTVIGTITANSAAVSGLTADALTVTEVNATQVNAGAIAASGKATVGGGATITGTVTITGNVTVSGTLTVG